MPLSSSSKFLFEDVDISDKEFLQVEVDFVNGSYAVSDPFPLHDKTKKTIDIKGLLFEITEKKDSKARPVVVYKQQFNFIENNNGKVEQQ